MKLEDRYGRVIYLDDTFSKPGEITINLPTQEFDKLVYQLLLWLHSNSNIIKFTLEKSEQQYYGTPDQYVKCLAYLLKKCSKNVKMYLIDLYEIEDPEKCDFDIVAKTPEPQNIILNYNPDSMLLIVYEDKTYLLDAKSFLADRGKLRSMNSSEFHISMSKEMRIPHYTDSRKSGLFLERYFRKELLFRNQNTNFEDFFIIRKEKNSRTAFFKAFQRTQLI